MEFSPQDREKILNLAAQRLVEELRAQIDFAELVSLPVNTVAHLIGLSPKQTARVLPLRPMGSRTKGVSLRALMDYQSGILKPNQPAA